MGRWIRYFIGSPERFMRTVVVFGLIAVILNPGMLRVAAGRLINELSPLLGPALTILIVLAGIRLIIGGGKK